MDRLTALESGFADLAARQLPVDGDLRNEVAELRALVENLPGARDSSLLQTRDLVPDVLGNDYKEKWRTWSYKFRDFLSIGNEPLRGILETVESKVTDRSHCRGDCRLRYIRKG